MRERAACLLLALAVSGFLPSPADPAEAGDIIKIAPPEIKQGLGYRGADITVTAAVTAGQEVILRCLGPEKDARLRRKGRVWGFWMNVGDVVFERVPTLCLFMSAAGPAGGGKAGKQEFELGCRALAAEGARSSRKEIDESLFSQFIKLKESEGLYSEKAGKIAAAGLAQNGKMSVRAVFRLPAKAAPATYTIELFGRGERGGRFVLLGKRPLVVIKSGASALLTRLLERHPLVYGCLAVLLACAAGLSVGFVFGKAGH